MKEEEFKKLIKFTELKSEHPDHTRIEARVELSENITLDKRERCDVEAAKEVLTEILIRRMYEDRRRELYDTIRELYRAGPSGFTETINKLIAIAKRQ